MLVGIDSSPASELATDIAFDEASRRGVDLVAMHAWSDAGEPEFPGMDFSTMRSREGEYWAERLAGWQERYPDVTVHRDFFRRPDSESGSSTSPSMRNSSSSAVTAAAGSRECCWAVSAWLWCSQCVCR